MRDPVLMERIAQHTSWDSTTGCQIWTGAHSHSGEGYRYPAVSIRGQTVSVRRAVLGLHGEPQLVIQADCGQRSCVNPAHLRAVPRPRIAQRGGAWHASKLTEEQVIKARCAVITMKSSITDLARSCGVAAGTMANAVLGKTWSHLPGAVPVDHARRHYWATKTRRRLSDDQVLDVYRRAHEGEAQAHIAREYHVSRALVSHIKVGRAYASVTGATP